MHHCVRLSEYLSSAALQGNDPFIAAVTHACKSLAFILCICLDVVRAENSWYNKDGTAVFLIPNALGETNSRGSISTALNSTDP